jgi:hypothetical protein
MEQLAPDAFGVRPRRWPTMGRTGQFARKIRVSNNVGWMFAGKKSCAERNAESAEIR